MPADHELFKEWELLAIFGGFLLAAIQAAFFTHRMGAKDIIGYYLKIRERLAGTFELIFIAEARRVFSVVDERLVLALSEMVDWPDGTQMTRFRYFAKALAKRPQNVEGEDVAEDEMTSEEDGIDSLMQNAFGGIIKRNAESILDDAAKYAQYRTEGADIRLMETASFGITFSEATANALVQLAQEMHVTEKKKVTVFRGRKHCIAALFPALLAFVLCIGFMLTNRDWAYWGALTALVFLALSLLWSVGWAGLALYATNWLDHKAENPSSATVGRKAAS